MRMGAGGSSGGNCEAAEEAKRVRGDPPGKWRIKTDHPDFLVFWKKELDIKEEIFGIGNDHWIHHAEKVYGQM